MRSERTPHQKRYGVVLALVLLGVLTGAWHNHTTDAGKPDVVSGAVRGVTAPPAGMLARASQWLSVQTGWIFHGHAVAAENQTLRKRVAELEGENARLQEAEINYDRLRADLKFVQKQGNRLLAAGVVARRPDPKFDTLVIGRGSGDGIAVNNTVVTRDGIVGRITEVGPNSAVVLMLTDQNSGVGARVQRPKSRATGVCKGENTNLLSMVYLPSDADIKPGDLIVTSGLGGVYPAGLVIGTVKEVGKDDGNALKVGRIVPKVDFERLEEVYVLR